MGGHALSTHVAIRLATADYERVASDCVTKFLNLYPTGRAHAIESYREKASHGDADILVTTENYDPYQAAEVLSAVEVVRNGPVTSIGVKASPDVPTLENNVFQVDLIWSRPEEFDYGKCYYSWNDVGNLIGRVAKSMFVSHKHNGMYFYFRDPEAPDRLFREILLTRNHDEALAYLGYDAARFNQGFDSLEDIFVYTSSTKFFRREIYLLENRNATSRVRDKKRPTYTGFLKWCESHPDLPAFAPLPHRSDWLPRMFEYFPHFKAEYEQALVDIAKLRAVKTKFNGEWVSQLTGVTGKELGELMKHIKESFGSSKEMRDFVLLSDTSVLETMVNNAFQDLARSRAT